MYKLTSEEIETVMKWFSCYKDTYTINVKDKELAKTLTEFVGNEKEDKNQLKLFV